MRFPDFAWCEIRIAGVRSRQLVRLKDVESLIKNLGPRMTDAHVSLCRFDKDAEAYSREVIPEIRKYEGSIKKYDGLRYADYVVIDIDLPKGEDGDDNDDDRRILQATGDAMPVALTVTNRLNALGLPDKCFAVYYSGSRGFHVYIPTNLFPFLEPHAKFHDFMHEFVIEVLKDTGLVERKVGGSWSGDKIDTGLYRPLHLIRLPNSIHPKSSHAFKTAVSRKMLETGKAEDVVKWSNIQRPLPLYAALEDDGIELVSMAKTCWQRLVDNDLQYVRASEVGGTYTPGLTHSFKSLNGVDKPGFGIIRREESRLQTALNGPIHEGEGFHSWGGRNEVLAYLIGALKRKYRMSRPDMMTLLHYWNMNACHPPIESDEFVATFDSLMPR